MTKASALKPVKRIVTGAGKYEREEYVAEVYQTRLVLRPKGCRRGGPAEVALDFGSLYLNAMMRRAK